MEIYHIIVVACLRVQMQNEVIIGCLALGINYHFVTAVAQLEAATITHSVRKHTYMQTTAKMMMTQSSDAGRDYSYSNTSHT